MGQNVVLEFDRNPNISEMDRLQSFLESVQRAFNEFEVSMDDLQLEEHPLVKSMAGGDYRILFNDYGYFKVLTANAVDSIKGDFKDLNAGYAKLDRTNIDKAWVEDLLVFGDFLADEFNADVGNFTKYLTGVKIYGDIIEAGTLKAEQVYLKGTDGKYYKISTDFTALPGGVEPVEEEAIHGSVLVKESITTDLLAASSVKANNIDVLTLDAISADLGTVTAGLMKSQNYADSEYSVGETGGVIGKVLSGLKIDLNDAAYYTPQITIKDNYIDLNGYLTVGKRSTEGTIGEYSLTNGRECIASGLCSYAGGAVVKAMGPASHAEGFHTVAGKSSPGFESYVAAHAEGYYTEALQLASHAEGYYTKADSLYQHVQGKYNIIDSSNIYAHIVGNGKSTTERSNAHTLDWNGNAWFAGKVSATDVILDGGSVDTRFTNLTKSLANAVGMFADYLPLAGGVVTGNVGIMGALTLNGSTMGDFVVNQGYDDGWYWEHWVSGKAVAWKQYNIKITGWSAWGSLYEASPQIGSYSIPDGIFLYTPNFACRAQCPDVGIASVETHGTGSATTTPQFWMTRPKDPETTGQIAMVLIEALGRWK